MEDDAGLARLLQKSLRRQGYQVDLAENGEVGLAMLADGQYDLVLTDNNMPVCEGLEVIRILAERELAPPVIMVTGNGNESTAVEALKLGATDYIVKDVEMGYLELLPMVIEKALQKRLMIQEREQMFTAIRESEERYRRLVDLSPDGIVILSDAEFVFANPAGASLLKAQSPDELQQRKMLDFVHPEFQETLLALLEVIENSASPAPWTEGKFICLDHSEVDVEVSGVPFIYQGKPALQIIFRDISERRVAHERLEYLANFDALTGLPNRRLFFDRLTCILSHCKRYKEQFSLLFLDLDRFKSVNDTLGHDAGDELLREVAKRTQECLRHADTVARMGGDEFAVILSRIIEPPDTGIVSDKIITALGRPFIIQGQQCHIGVSIGVSIFPDHAENAESLLKAADSAMYCAKENGRNCYRYFSTVEG
ncbi:MAG: diguanylate cyclase [Steroidobacteraceae bacterium]|nr:diguanylate cyclase [Deltaproteobacteria bacterium]